MKKIILALVLALFCLKPTYSQLCGTPIDTNASGIELGPMPEHFDTIVIKVYPHAVRDDNGEGGHPLSYVKQAMCILKHDFQPYNILFDFQPIDEIDNTQLLNLWRPEHDSLWPQFDAITNPYIHSDGINIFFLGDPNDTIKGSFAREIISNSMYIGGSFGDHIPHSTTSFVTHEMGHCLGLYHTFMGSGSSWCNFYFSPFGGGPCAEWVDGSNCSSCGDLLCGTPADPGVYRVTERACFQLPSLWFAYDSIITYDCQYNWNYVNNVYISDSSGTSRKYVYDSLGEPYNPDMTNYMTYTYARCMQNFSPDQHQKMRYVLNNNLTNVLSTQENFPYGLDLMVKTAEDDYGEEPYTKSAKLWKSPDIWVRNQSDGFVNQVSQNPYYDSINNNPVYVYVRVRNNSCEDYPGGGYLKLYWAKAGTALSWPGNWINAFQNGLPYGDILDSVQYSGFSAWGEQIFQFEWHPEDPSQYFDYFADQQPWHFCLLARIVDPNDPMTVPEGSSIHANVANNNNIGWRNVYIVYPPESPFYSPGGIVAIGSVTDEDDETYSLTFTTEAVSDHFLTDEAEVTLMLDEISWQKWDEGGRLGDKIEIVDEGKRKIRLLEDGAYIDGLLYNPMERSTVMLSFNFLVDELTTVEEFDSDLIQRVSGGEQEIVGGETYIVTKDLNRMPFEADAGIEQMIVTGDSVLLEAEDIGEEAIYNWYVNDTTKVYSGRQFLAYPEETYTYKLEVIATDGYKDYDSVKVQVKQFAITNISPNPADNQVTVSYRIKQNSSAQLVILRSSGTEMVNQSLSGSDTDVTINVSGFPAGTYTAVIRTGNQNVDSKNFVVQ